MKSNYSTQWLSSRAVLSAGPSVVKGAGSRAKNMRGMTNYAAGLTLIEVLIALAIVGIALTAVIKATSQNIRATSYLQEKTIAMWVGEQALNEARAGILTLPNTPNKLKETTNMLGRDWHWEAAEEETPNKRIKKIEVNVYRNQHEETAPIITLESYVYHEEQ